MKARRKTITIPPSYRGEFFEKLKKEGWKLVNPNISDNRLPPGYASEVLKVICGGWYKFYKRTPSYVVFDNEGKTLDRYTIINEDGDILGLSETGAGFSQFCGNCVDGYMDVSYGASWRRHLNVPRVIHRELPRIIEEFESEGRLGKRIAFSGLSEELQVHIRNRFGEYDHWRIRPINNYDYIKKSG